MTIESKTGLQAAGGIDIEALVIVNALDIFLDVRDYLIELNLYEDIYSNALHGTIQLSDSRNLLKELAIIGNEQLIVKLKTPSFPHTIYKTFRIYAITDRLVVRDQNTQIYTLHFCSQEAIKDSIQPIFKSFTGNIDEVVQDIFAKYLETPRTHDVSQGIVTPNKETTELRILNPTQNAVKFVSPGWSPFRCINWLSSKSIPAYGKACTYLFWETTKAFYFGNIESIFEANNKNKLGNLGTYTYSAKNVSGGTEEINDKMFLVENMEVVKTTDHLNNYTSGYLSNRLITLDVINKKYELVDYDHVNNFSNYQHAAGVNSIPLFIDNSPRDPGTSIRFYPINPGLHSIKNNVNEKMPQIYGNRTSNLMELNNFKINLTVPGRSDAEVGMTLDFNFPDISPTSPEDVAKNNNDTFYSGTYIITAIRHKINLLRHTMTMELVKDSLTNKAV